MSRRRSRLDIYLDMLEKVASGIEKPTRLMYATNLGWKPMQEVLEALKTQDLVTVSEEKKGNQARRRIGITEKGKKALDYFKAKKKEYGIT